MQTVSIFTFTACPPDPRPFANKAAQAADAVYMAVVFSQTIVCRRDLSSPCIVIIPLLKISRFQDFKISRFIITLHSDHPFD